MVKTSWGDPDLQGVWTSDDSIGVPFERPKRYGSRKLLNDDEYAERAKENDLLATSIQARIFPDAGYWAHRDVVDAEAYPSNWSQYARHTSRQTSLIVDPEEWTHSCLDAISHGSASHPACRFQKTTASGIVDRHQHVRVLHHARRLRLHAAGNVWKRDTDRAVTRVGCDCL
jgi:hypothetical protein